MCNHSYPNSCAHKLILGVRVALARLYQLTVLPTSHLPWLRFTNLTFTAQISRNQLFFFSSSIVQHAETPRHSQPALTDIWERKSLLQQNGVPFKWMYQPILYKTATWWAEVCTTGTSTCIACENMKRSSTLRLLHEKGFIFMKTTHIKIKTQSLAAIHLWCHRQFI